MMIPTNPLGPLVTALEGAGLRVSTNPTTLRAPGVLVTLLSFQALALDGAYETTAQVRVVVPDAPAEKATDELVALVNTVLTVVKPDGPVVALGLVLTSSSTPLPALSFPVNI